MARLEGQHLTGVGQLISQAKLDKDKPEIEMHTLHEMANCPPLKTAMRYYLPLYVTVKGGKFVDEADGKARADLKLCDLCVK